MRKVVFCCLIGLVLVVTLTGCGGGSASTNTISPAQAVAAAKLSLTVGYSAGDTSSNVTQNLSLALTGSDNTVLAWASSNLAVVNAGGVVTRPLTGDVNLTLTATITSGTVSDTKTFPITVKAQMTDAEAVAAAKAALAIGYAAGDSAASVTQGLTFAVSGIDNSTVAWASSIPSTVTVAGVVSRPLTGDANVTLTATITVGSASDTKSFSITVKAQMTDAEAVAAAKAALAIGYAEGDSHTTVTQNLSLPATCIDGTTVTWVSSEPAVVAIDGGVSRPVTGDVPVTITATIQLNDASDTKAFLVNVRAQMTDGQAVAAAKFALAIGYSEGDSALNVTGKLTLPLTGSSGCTVSWASSAPSLVAEDGSVTRPATGDASVTLTATIRSHEVSDTASYTLNIKGQISDADAVAAAKADLNIGYAPGDSAGSVTHNVSLAGTGTDGCAITWDSDTPALISNAGTVTPPSSDDVVVTLTATIASHGASDTKVFELTVKAVMDDTAAVAADKAALTIGYGAGDSPASVTKNIVLPTSGTNGSSITWASSVPEMITSSGGVTVPSDSDASVTMTATVSRGSATDTVDFHLTVKALLLSSWINGTAISPGNGAIEVDPGIVVRLPFTRSLDSETVDASTFQIIKTTTAQAVSITLSYDAPSQTVSLAPVAPLEEDTQYSIVVSSAVRDSDERNLPTPMGFNFTTLSYADILAQWKFNGNGDDAAGKGNVFNLVDMDGDAVYVTDVVHEGSASMYVDGMGMGYGTSNINLGSKLTVAVWVNIDNPMPFNMNTIMANAEASESANGFKLCINRWGSSDQSVVIEVGNGSTGGKWRTAPGLIQPGTWYHLAFVIDQPGHVMKIFYNGAEAPLAFVSDQGFNVSQFQYNFKTAGPFAIGTFGGIDEGAYPYKGHLDDMRVYNRVLSNEEIAKIAQEK